VSCDSVLDIIMRSLQCSNTSTYKSGYISNAAGGLYRFWQIIFAEEFIFLRFVALFVFISALSKLIMSRLCRPSLCNVGGL